MSKKNLAVSFLIFFLSFPLCVSARQRQFPELKGYKSTMNFRVWAPTQENADIIASELEEYYKEFLSDLKYGGMLKKKPEIRVFKNYEEYIDKTRELGYNTTHTGGIAISRSARRPAKIYFFLSNRLIQVLRHELTHVLFKEITAGLKTNAKIPLWLNEGIAVYEERGMPYKAIVSGALKAGRVIPVGEVVSYTTYPTDRDKNHLFYAQSASLVDFLLNKYGGTKFLVFSRKQVRNSKSINEALSSTYYPHIKNVSQLSGAWLNSLKK